MDTKIIDEVFRVLLVILMAGIISGRLARLVRLPDVILYLLAGILLGKSGLGWISLSPGSPANQLIVVFGTAFILFHGGLSLNILKLRETGFSIFLLVTLGVGITAVCIGGTFFLAGVGPLLYGLLLGGVISPTDPASLIPVLQQVKVSARLETLVEGESGFNDPMGAVLVFMILHQIQQATSGAGSLLSFLGMQVLGSVVLGIIIGFIVSLLVHEKWEHLIDEFTPLTILIIVFGGFYITDKFSGSGYLAVFVAGIVLGNIRHFNLRIRHKYLVETHTLSISIFQMMKMFIFIILGSHIVLKSLTGQLLPAFLITLLLVFVFRPIVVFICLKFPGKPHWSLREVVFASWTRETGVMPAALASLLISQNIKYADFIVHTTFIAILFTLLVQASTTGLLAKKLGLVTE